MTIKETAYNTTACSGHLIEGVKQAVEQAYHMGELSLRTGNVDNPALVFVVGGAYQDQNIPQFAHPIAFHTREGWKVAVDVRSFGRLDPANGTFIVRDPWGRDALIIRGVLQEVWLNDNPQTLRSFSRFPMTIYANWLAEVIAKRLALEVGDQSRLVVLAAIFYFSQFNDDMRPSLEGAAMGNLIRQATGFKGELIAEVMQKCQRVNDVEDFCAQAKAVTQNVRLDQLNPSILLQIVGGAWYGINARETIAVAVEHPPTWISLVWHALMDRGMRHSGLTKQVERSMYRRDAELFRQQLLNFVKSA